MTELPLKPEGSVIEELEDFDGRIYRWKPPSGGMMRYLLAAFLSFWLCGWAVGFVFVVWQLLNNNGNGGAELFLMAWLGAWTIGGIFAFYMVYLLLRPPRPEYVALKFDSLIYDPGSAPLTFFMNPWYAMRTSNPNEIYGKLFKRRKKIEIDKRELGGFVLERVGERQRLYFDHGAERVEIGEHLREPEREWLAQVIQAWNET